MKLISHKVNTYPNYANRPILELTVDRVPSIRELTFNAKDMGHDYTLYYGELDGFVKFMLHNSRDEKGYGGAIFTVTLENGDVRAVTGPWSSRSGVVNGQGFGPCVEVHLFETEGDHAGAGPVGGAVTIDWLKANGIKMLPVQGDELRFEPVTESGDLYKPLTP